MDIFDKRNGRLLNSAQLNQDWQKFSYLAVEEIRISFDEGTAPEKDVFLREASNFEIEHPDSWGIWSCGSANENERCSWVREGKFQWSGDYIVHVKKVL